MENSHALHDLVKPSFLSAFAPAPASPAPPCHSGARTPGPRTRRHPYRRGDLGVEPRAPAGGVRSVDAVHGRPDLPHSFHLPFTLSGGGRMRPNSSHSLSSPRAIPFSPLTKPEQPRRKRKAGEEKELGSFSRSGLIARFDRRSQSSPFLNAFQF